MKICYNKHNKAYTSFAKFNYHKLIGQEVSLC